MEDNRHHDVIMFSYAHAWDVGWSAVTTTLHSQHRYVQLLPGHTPGLGPTIGTLVPNTAVTVGTSGSFIRLGHNVEMLPLITNANSGNQVVIAPAVTYTLQPGTHNVTVYEATTTAASVYERVKILSDKYHGCSFNEPPPWQNEYKMVLRRIFLAVTETKAGAAAAEGWDLDPHHALTDTALRTASPEFRHFLMQQNGLAAVKTLRVCGLYSSFTAISTAKGNAVSNWFGQSADSPNNTDDQFFYTACDACYKQVALLPEASAYHGISTKWRKPIIITAGD